MKKYRKIADIQKMPGFTMITGYVGFDSVSKGQVTLVKGRPECKRHGAINCRAIRQDGWLYRCSELDCDQGCFIPKHNLLWRIWDYLTWSEV